MSLDPHPLTITAADGVRLSGTRFGRPDTPATLVYLHGLLTDSTFWTPLTRRLSHRLGEGIAQVVYDQRGHGHSQWPPKQQHTTLRRLAEDLDEVLAHAQGAVVLVAHSAASLVVHTYIEHSPCREVAGLVLFNAACHFRFHDMAMVPAQCQPTLARLRHQRRRRLDPVAAAGHAMLERRLRALDRQGKLAHSFVTGARRGDPRVLADLLQQCNETRLSAQAAVAMRSTPSFVLGGELDRIVAAHDSVRLADAIWADYEMIPGATHSLPHTHPELAEDAVLRALEVAYRDHESVPAVDGADW
ncbi:alpha/beta hydrolase [Nocardia sp. NPDC050435]|uniref:alpha/beta fold hydrolase n=1 Tax=Nocardia sp. NPDC050435 TaxID=3155040 RepID=UPI0033E732B0